MNGKNITVVNAHSSFPSTNSSLAVDGNGNYTFTIGNDEVANSLVTTKDSLKSQLDVAIVAYNTAHPSAPAGITVALASGVDGNELATNVEFSNEPLTGGNFNDPDRATPARYKFTLITAPAANEKVTIGGRTYKFVSGTPGVEEVQLNSVVGGTEWNLAEAIYYDADNAYSAQAIGSTIVLQQRVPADEPVPTVVFSK